MDIVFKDQAYRIGDGGIPLELTASRIAPAGPLAGWQEIREPFGVGPDYCRAYVSNCGLQSIITASVELDHRRWLHVSVSHRNGRLPTWKEMARIKETFCGTERYAYQVHAPTDKHVNIHQVLHLWCPLDGPVLPDFTRGGGTI